MSSVGSPPPSLARPEIRQVSAGGKLSTSVGTSKQGATVRGAGSQVCWSMTSTVAPREKHPPPAAHDAPSHTGFEINGLCAVQSAKCPGALPARLDEKNWSQRVKRRA